MTIGGGGLHLSFRGFMVGVAWIAAGILVGVRLSVGKGPAGIPDVVLVVATIALAAIAVAASNGGTARRAPRELRRADPWEPLRRELQRSRRRGHSFTVLRVAGTPALADAVARFGHAGTPLDSAFRAIDCVWVERGNVYLLLPESDHAAAEGFLRRVASEAPGLLSGDIRMAVFPRDGLTSGAIMAALDAEATSPAGNGHVPAAVPPQLSTRSSYR
jgi:hypothetical protein